MGDNVPKDFFWYIQQGTHQGEIFRRLKKIEEEEMGKKRSEFTGFSTVTGLESSDQRLLPGMVEDADDVPFTNGFGGKIIGKADIRIEAEGLVADIELNDAGMALFDSPNAGLIDWASFDPDDYEE